MNVWLAFEGEYEDRSPYAAFATKELAEADLRARHGDPGEYALDIEEFEVRGHTLASETQYEQQAVVRKHVTYQWQDSDGNHGPELPTVYVRRSRTINEDSPGFGKTAEVRWTALRVNGLAARQRGYDPHKTGNNFPEYSICVVGNDEKAVEHKMQHLTHLAHKAFESNDLPARLW